MGLPWPLATEHTSAPWPRPPITLFSPFSLSLKLPSQLPALQPSTELSLSPSYPPHYFISERVGTSSFYLIQNPDAETPSDPNTVDTSRSGRGIGLRAHCPASPKFRCFPDGEPITLQLGPLEGTGWQEVLPSPHPT